MSEVDNNQQPKSEYSLQVDCASTLNFVLQQNSVPLIRQILISSIGNVADSRIVIRSNPEYFKEHTIHIASLGADQILSLDKPKLNFDIKLLQELPENMKGNIEILWLSEQNEVLTEQCIEIDLLTIDTWGGEQQPIELLASFSQPNASSLSPILMATSEILRATEKNGLNGYLDRDKELVLNQLNALWQALLFQNLHYIVSPASFVKAGQRIRLAKQIFEEKLACCLDTTLLFSALAEQIGLDTLIVIEEGHAYVGVWLNETPNIDLIIDDVQALRKRYDLGEVVFIETTLLTQQARFGSALETAKTYIKDESRQHKFYLAIDVRQARLRGIKPISSQQQKKNYLDETEIEWTPASTPVYDIERLVETKSTRVDRWLRRLLDLSLRNKLLNFKDNRYSIPLQCSESILGKLEDTLANNEGFLFKSIDSISLKDVQRDNESQHIYQYVDESLSRKLLFSPLDTPLLEKRLIEVYRASRTALEEGGANTLFLAIGFLEWKESERSKRTFKAPLMLIPVQITRETAKTGYRLFMYDDEPRFNSTLLQLLRQDFELDIAGLNPLPTDDSGIDVNKVLQIVRKAIVNIAGWEVKAEAAIGQFSFSKYLMWLDLSSRMDQLKNQSVVNHLIESPREPFIKQDEFPQPAQLDQQYQPQQLFTPLSSDSSQLAAVMSAALGRTFVLSGPPGTGKSQTITNMISQCLADGKSVLFVSEKMAALEVVYRRLTQIGLSELCLQLHSSKSQKMEVLDQLRERAEKNNDPYFLSNQSKTTEWQKLSNQLVKTRDELNEHVKILHTAHEIGWSLYTAMSDELRYRDTPNLRFPEINIGTLTLEKREQLSEIVTKAVSLRQLVSQNVNDVLDGFAEGISTPIWNLVWQEQYKVLQDQLIEQIQDLQKITLTWQQAFGFNEKQKLNEIKQDLLLFTKIVDFVQQVDIELLSRVKDLNINNVKKAEALANSLNQERRRFYKLVGLDKEIKIQNSIWKNIWQSFKGVESSLVNKIDSIQGVLQPWQRAFSFSEKSTLDEFRKDFTVYHAISNIVEYADVDLIDAIKDVHIDTIHTLKEVTADLSKQRSNVVGTYNPLIYTLDLELLGQKWQQAEDKVWPFSWLGKFQIRNLLKTYQTVSQRPTVLTAANDLPVLNNIKKQQNKMAEYESQLASRLGHYWQGENSDWLKIERACQQWLAVNQIMNNCTDKQSLLKIFQFCKNQNIETIGIEIGELESLLQKFSANGKEGGFELDSVELKTLKEILQLIGNYQEEFVQISEEIEIPLERYWQGENTDWSSIQNAYEQWQTVKQIVVSTITDQTALLAALAFSKQHSLDGLKQALVRVEASMQQLVNDHTLQTDSHVTQYLEINFTDIIERQRQLQQQSSAWRHWLNWQAIKYQLITHGLKPLAFELLHAPLEQDAALKRLNINLARHWITHQFSQHPELNQFNSQQHEQKIQSFAQQDKEHQFAASQEIIHRWNGIFTEQNQYKGQWTVLNKELGKKRRHLPVRELMRQIPDVLVGLKPCLLMSPLSVAQYLDTEAKFDVVIFDEASQIPVWDAIGALARGKQSIVVGDNKQMPPTSFFGKGDSDEEVDEEVTEDLESILDECLAAQLPELALNWHYRSRYESLIQFSNQKYYKGGLFTFPAPVAKDTAVKLHVVDGVYDKGDTRTNINEAKAIVEFIIQHLQSQLGHENPLTLGVVTFNMTQQKLIEDLLDNELVSHPELETLSKSGIEPLFVKNLENVQGDERDIIVFSITYAKDQAGRLSMNFGALNRQGGQRRLNVAITRARQGLHVFSALNPEEINLTRTNSEGVRDLKDFLVFARSGQLHLNYVDRNKQQAKKELVQYLQTKLHEQGWNVDVGIGQGDSCVDLAIKDDLNSGSYIAGILVDGENYAKAATARDRDQLRPTVLNGLGWEVLSVWTVDWWLDPEQNLTNLIQALDEIKVSQNVA
ncbi:DUF4011 domain-containing protein [Acinetobacter sp. ESBL14]|uniref:DUF4011 domain-containing protein n=1 Tax=Acinetobacter sp. ESBL14 TaxID=3077329 RepID=UPI002FCC6A8C